PWATRYSRSGKWSTACSKRSARLYSTGRRLEHVLFRVRCGRSLVEAELPAGFRTEPDRAAVRGDGVGAVFDGGDVREKDDVVGEHMRIEPGEWQRGFEGPLRRPEDVGACVGTTRGADLRELGMEDALEVGAVEPGCGAPQALLELAQPVNFGGVHHPSAARDGTGRSVIALRCPDVSSRGDGAGQRSRCTPKRASSERWVRWGTLWIAAGPGERSR